MAKICILYHILLYLLIKTCESYKILAIFPHNGHSHHIYFSSLIEELALRDNDVTAINYLPVKKIPKLKQILLKQDTSDTVNMEDHLKIFKNSDFFKVYDSVKAFEYMASSSCEKLMRNKEVQSALKDNKYDVVIVEQFVTDCGLALAYKVNAPTVGMTAHVLMPWTYSRLGAPNNPSYVPNHFFSSGTEPDLISRIKSVIINMFLNGYYSYVIQRKNQETVNEVYPGTPDLEDLGKNMTLILLNQYFPLTGSRVQGANVIEVGGMHIARDNTLKDEELELFLSSSEKGVIYISFGTVASKMPRYIIDEICSFLKHSNMRFVWKLDDIEGLEVPKNVFARKWLPQPAILCHEKVKAFISHSGMLSSSEAMHCGVPIVSLPLFGDQFANAKSAVDNGLGVTLDISALDEKKLSDAVDTVLQKKYQDRAKHLSRLWKDRPMSPMDTAIYWIEYVARHKGDVNLKPSTVHLPLYKYLLLDIFCIFLGIMTAISAICLLPCLVFKRSAKDRKVNKKKVK